MNTTTLRGLRTAIQHQRVRCSITPSSFHSTNCTATRPKSNRSTSLRYASTSTPAISSQTTNTLPKTQFSSYVNAPLTTLPPPLALPTRQPDQRLPSYIFHVGRAYARFYKTGVMNTYANFKLARAEQDRLDKHNTPSFSSAIKAHTITRSQFLLLTRNWHDVKRLPLFALVLIIFGEFTPLLIVVVSGIVPFTCRIPKQVHSDRAKLEERRRISFRNLTAKLPIGKGGVEDLNRMQLLHISWSLGLSSKLWDYLGGELPGLPTSWLRRRVRKRVEYLQKDDKLIERAGGVKDMDLEELKIALVERGVDILGKDEKGMRADLGAWLKSKDSVSVERLLLTRPLAWPVKPSDVKAKP